MIDFGNEWTEILKEETEKLYFTRLQYFLDDEYSKKTIYPPREDVFNALRYTSYSDVKAVIIGQDPYHGEGQAHGLCFSVREGVEIPPSLMNIYKELNADLGLPVPDSGYLKRWADEGVLLMNAVLTVEKDKANSHRKQGWEEFTDAVIMKLNEREEPVVFLLWGNNAKAKADLITNNNHLILEAAHPSPLSASRGFFGCRHFSKCNRYLEAWGKEGINW